MEKNFPILYYHFIKAPSATTRIKGLYTTAKHFEWQLVQLIKKGFTFITFEDIALKRYDVNKLNMILTFDDGCESLYYKAFPILKKYGIKAVIYVVTGSIGARNIVWELNENKDPLNILTKEQLLEMTSYGIEIGSHLCNHVHLSQLPADEMKYELVESKRWLENELGKQIYSVAYPFGSYNNEVLKTATDTGYLFGVTTKSGNNLTAGDLELFRIPVKGYSLRHYWYFYKTFRNQLNIIN
ncbi:MAG: polysaccharide deacetylase family protein [Paludibacter sp.]|nr:polysaccharide deacetylase family protein [Paludibacter sp.]